MLAVLMLRNSVLLIALAVVAAGPGYAEDPAESPPEKAAEAGDGPDVGPPRWGSDQCPHTSEYEQLQALLAASYCLATVKQSNLQTFAVQRCYASANTCQAACEAHGNDAYKKPAAHVSGAGTELGCRRKDSPPFVFGGRPGSWYDKDVPACDWCCCQVR